MNNINIIGITGSYGKTSSKMALNTILAKNYNGFYTPGSFNTPNGIVITINNQTTIFNDYFICEMGAKAVGEIKELCDIVHPKYGILTSIGPAHIESFKNIDNICKTKFELIESLPSDGIAILNKDDSYQTSYKLNNDCKVVWIGIENKADVMAKNINILEDGMTFDMVINKETISCRTKLLGNKNIYNILAASALAKEIGMSIKDIQEAILDMKAPEHRLELKKIGKYNVIDDAYNSNPEGANMALEVLSKMPGKRIIITPGMVEMGDKDRELHLEFGKKMASCADFVYLIGKNKTKDIYEGLQSQKYKESNIKIYNNFNDAYNDAIKSFDKDFTILIENDLPDSYLEG